ncbi:hypothetical protein V491_03507 [Pseudogymnoascus sp. VKM F-3775]|nr:hypothetical protein V491_03507 [Pseudogymnoascus sp. VKM F-3775]
MKWPCALQPCDLTALRAFYGQCELCHGHFCSNHVASTLHTCPTKEDIHTIYTSGDPAKLKDLNSIRRTAGEKMISRLLETINYDALQMRAETLRGGIKCTVDLPPATQSYFNFDVLGGCNYHGSIVFEDGKTWLARFRLPNHTKPPLQERNFDRRSEFATYCFLTKTTVPVPEVYDYANDDDPANLIGTGYILLEKSAGKPLAWHEANEIQKGKFSRQLEEMYVDLAQHPRGGLGRLQLSSSGLLEAGPAFFDYNSKGNLIPFGPFSHSNDYHTALIQHRIHFIKTG